MLLLFVPVARGIELEVDFAIGSGAGAFASHKSREANTLDSRTGTKEVFDDFWGILDL